MEEEKEEWRDVVGYEGLYQVSSFGNIKRLNSRLKGSGYLKKIIQNGYMKVTLCRANVRKDFRVCRLVALSFHPNYLNHPQVNHIDENKVNDHYRNLEWCTAKYNMNYGTRGKRAGLSLMDKYGSPVLQIDDNGCVVKEWNTISEACRNTGCKFQNISKVCLGRGKRTGGFYWKYSGKL